LLNDTLCGGREVGVGGYRGGRETGSREGGFSSGDRDGGRAQKKIY